MVGRPNKVDLPHLSPLGLPLVFVANLTETMYYIRTTFDEWLTALYFGYWGGYHTTTIKWLGSYVLCRHINTPSLIPRPSVRYM